MTKKLAILSVSAGAGHVRAAEALRSWAKREHPDLHVDHIDVMDLVPSLFRSVYCDSYIKVVDRHPALWGFLYHKSDHAEADDSKLAKLRMAIQRLNTRKLTRCLERIAPDSIICTHFLPAELLSKLVGEGKVKIPCWVQVTDFDVHHLWIHERMSGYFAASPEVAWRMRDRGLPEEQVHVTGIPVMPAFSRSYAREKCAADLKIDSEKKTVLLMSGGLGVGGIRQITKRLLQLDDDFQILAVTGHNKDLLEDLKGMAQDYPNRLFPYGFTKVMERLMAAADLVVSKPGGLTTSECLAMGKPMILISPIPGQEERNADYLLENGVALKAHDEAGLEFRVTQLLARPERLQAMAERAKEIARPFAAREVLSHVLTSSGDNCETQST